MAKSTMPSMSEVRDAIEQESRSRYWPPVVTLKDGVVTSYTEELHSYIHLSREGTTYRIRQSFDPIVTTEVRERGTFPGAGLSAKKVAETLDRALIALPADRRFKGYR
jgi:hypothetical protein